MTLLNFLTTYAINLNFSSSKHEAYERTEAEHIALTGKRRYSDYLLFCKVRYGFKKNHHDRNWVDAKPKVKNKADLGEFVMIFRENLPDHPHYYKAYEAAEVWHVERYGQRRFKTWANFASRYHKFHNQNIVA